MYLNNETKTVTIVTPADGPSLPTAPAGKWIWTSVRSSRSTPSSAVKEYCDGQTERRYGEQLASSRRLARWGAAQKMAQEKQIREKRGVERRENVCSLLAPSLSLLNFAPSVVFSLHAPTKWTLGRDKRAIISWVTKTWHLVHAIQTSEFFFKGYSRISKDNFVIFEDSFQSTPVSTKSTFWDLKLCFSCLTVDINIEFFLSCGLKYSWTCPQNSRTAGKNSRTFQGESLKFAFSFKVFSRIPYIKTFQDLCESSQKKTNSCFQNSLPSAIIWIKTNLTARYSLSKQTKDHLPRLSGSSTSLTLTAQIPSWRHLKIKKCLSLVKRRG